MDDFLMDLFPSVLYDYFMVLMVIKLLMVATGAGQSKSCPILL